MQVRRYAGMQYADMQVLYGGTVCRYVCRYCMQVLYAGTVCRYCMQVRMQVLYAGTMYAAVPATAVPVE